MTQYEYRVKVPSMYCAPSDEPSITINISAFGGGTVGESYADNRWSYLVTATDAIRISGDDLRSGGTGATHAQMARTLASFLSAAGESLRWSGDDSEYAKEYTGRVREFLESEYERLGMFADDSA